MGQSVGDSIEITSYSNRTYNGRITKIDTDGYFLKTNFNTIFISNREIKEYQLFNIQRDLKKEDEIINNVNQDSSEYFLKRNSDDVLIENKYYSDKTSFSISGWYGLADLNLSDLNLYGRSLKINGIGPFGFTGEVIFKKPFKSFDIKINDIGIGLDYIYTQENANWPYGLISTRIQFRINYYTNEFKSKKIKQYYGIGVGLSFDQFSYFNYYYTNTGSSLRLCYGVKYYMSKKIKLGSEIGIGGSILRGMIQIDV